MRLSTACLVLATVLAASALPAQSTDSLPAPADSLVGNGRAFSTITLRVSGLANLNRERLHEYWRPGGGVELEGSTPLPVGEAAIGLAALPFRSRGEEQPDFDALLLSVRWSGSRAVAGPLALRGSLLLGNLFMRFEDGDRAVQGLTTESELLVGAGAGVELRATRWIGATAGATYHRVLTRLPIDLLLVNVGVRATAPTPRWLRGVLE